MGTPCKERKGFLIDLPILLLSPAAGIIAATFIGYLSNP
jgi:hypothetical protein